MPYGSRRMTTARPPVCTCSATFSAAGYGIIASNLLRGPRPRKRPEENHGIEFRRRSPGPFGHRTDRADCPRRRGRRRVLPRPAWHEAAVRVPGPRLLRLRRRPADAERIAKSRRELQLDYLFQGAGYPGGL